jgi:phospholipase/carboxylesterase
VVEGAGPARQGPVLRLSALAPLCAALLVGCGDARRAAFDGPPPALVERVVQPRNPDAGPPPLLVLLHGLGSNENDLVPVAAQLDPRFLVVSLRAPRTYQAGYAWFQITWRGAGELQPDVAQARDALGGLARWLAAAPARLGADPRRVYLLGFSQGAMMSLGVLRTVPERVAGAVALSGKFNDTLFDEPPARRMGDVGLFVGHGTQDDLLPVTDGRAIRDLFQPLVRDFAYHEYPISHAISPAEIRDVAAWLTGRLN